MAKLFEEKKSWQLTFFFLDSGSNLSKIILAFLYVSVSITSSSLERKKKTSINIKNTWKHKQTALNNSSSINPTVHQCFSNRLINTTQADWIHCNSYSLQNCILNKILNFCACLHLIWRIIGFTTSIMGSVKIHQP